MTYYIYIAKCADGTLYTGFTNDLEKRLKAHNDGRGAKYTKTRLPVVFVHTEAFQTEGEARSREWHVKQLSRKEKLKLIERSNEEQSI